MKKFPVLLIVILVCAPLLTAQNSDKYQFGDRQITIPAPDGFINAFGRFPIVTARLNATESPGNDMLAVHVAESMVSKLQVSEDIDLAYYTKVSDLKSRRTLDNTAEFYKQVVAEIEQNFGTYTDPNGDNMKNMEKNSEKGLKEIGRGTTVDLTSTKNLGSFEKTDRVYSAMMLIGAELYGRKVMTLAAFSFMYINQRLVTVSVYKQSPTDADLKDVPAFTKKWTAKIIAANK